MPDPTIVGIGAEVSNTTTGAQTLTASQPSGLRNGDLLLVVLRQDYQHTNGAGNIRTHTDPTGVIATAPAGASSIGVSSSLRVSLNVHAIPRTGSGSVSVDIAAGGGIVNLYERLFIIGVRNASTIRNTQAQSVNGTTPTWPTTAQTLTVGADDSAAISIITNRSTTAQTLSTANGFSVSHDDIDQPAVAVAYRTVNTPSQAVPLWTGSGILRAQVTFEVVWGPSNSGIFIDGAVHLAG
jgi:hypothetical protein